MGRVEGKVAIVTGAAGGLGVAMTNRLLEEGAKVVATDINVGKLVALFEKSNSNLLLLEHDVSEEADWVRIVAAALDRFQCVDVLVNNAGIVMAGNLEDTSLEDFRTVSRVHSEGTFLGCKHTLPAMTGSGDGGGSIINMSSVTALGGFPYVLAYSSAKGAVRSMTKSIAAAFSADGVPVRCNSIHPGRIQTDMIDNCRDQRVEKANAEAVDEGNPPGLPEDVAHLVVYLASDESLWINGSEFVVDNGASITDGAVKRRVRK